MLWTVLLASKTIVLNVFTAYCLVLFILSRVSCCANSVSMLLARVIRLDLRSLSVAAFHISNRCTDPIQPHNASPPPLDRHQDDDYGDEEEEEEEEKGEHH